MSPLIVCAGIAVIDHLFRVDRFPSPERKTRASDFRAIGGGCAANAAMAFARLGGRVRLAAPLGDDAIGEAILAGLRNENVECDGIVRVPGATSPISAIFVDASGERMIVTHRDDRLDGAHPPALDALLAGAQGVLLDNRCCEFVLPIAEAARHRGLPVVLDADKPTSEADASLRICSHVIFSAEALRETAGLDDLGRALLRMAEQTGAFLAVTDGANDILWIENGRMRRVPVFSIRAVDTLGAGDVFHAAFTLALLEAQDVPACMRFAAAAAAIKCTRFGGITGAPGRPEVEDFLRERI